MSGESTNNTYTNVSDLPTMSEITSPAYVPVEDANKDGKKVDLSTVIPGTLKTTNTTAQATNASEPLTGTVNLHKVAKTGSYNDLLDRPTIPDVGTLDTTSTSALETNASEPLSGKVKLHKIAKTGTARDAYWGFGNNDMENCFRLWGSSNIGSGYGFTPSWFEYIPKLIGSGFVTAGYRSTYDTDAYLDTYSYLFDETSSESMNYHKIFERYDGALSIYKFIGRSHLASVLNFNDADDELEYVYWSDKAHSFGDLERINLLISGDEDEFLSDLTQIHTSLIKIIPSTRYTKVIPLVIAFAPDNTFDDDYDENWEFEIQPLKCINMNTPQIDVSKAGFIRITEGFYEIFQ